MFDEARDYLRKIIKEADETAEEAKFDYNRAHIGSGETTSVTEDFEDSEENYEESYCSDDYSTTSEWIKRSFGLWLALKSHLLQQITSNKRSYKILFQKP